MAENSCSRTDLDHMAVDFENNPEVREILGRIVPLSDHKARGRGVVSNNIRQSELEVLIPAINDLHCRSNRFDRRQRLHRCDLSGKRCLHKKSHFRFNPWLNETCARHRRRSEEHTSELQSLMRISYAVFCSKHKAKGQTTR